jgi:hypothetical protein
MLKQQRREELNRQFAQPDRFQRGYQQPLYSRATAMQQQMVGHPQMRAQLPIYTGYRGPFPASYPPSAVPQVMQPMRATIYSTQNVPLGYGGWRLDAKEAAISRAKHLLSSPIQASTPLSSTSTATGRFSATGSPLRKFRNRWPFARSRSVKSLRTAL